MKFYHATFEDNLAQILRQGLKQIYAGMYWQMAKDKYVYLAMDPTTAHEIVAGSDVSDEYFMENRIVILEVDGDFLDPDLLEVDGNMDYEENEPECFQYNGDVPPEAISIHRTIEFSEYEDE